jgi:predicted nucleotidyltransferase
MSRAPNDPREIFPDIVSDYKSLFGNDLVSILLYGSGASGDYVAGKSDINFMIVLSDEGIDSLDKAFSVTAKWNKRRVAAPLFLTEAYINSSLDVFPMEYLNFQNNYILVHGKDVLEDLVFDPPYLRLQCEREVKGKLLILREAFLESQGKAKRLHPIVADSLGAFAAIFNALLHLRGEPVPRRRRDAVKAFCKTFGMNAVAFEKLMDIRDKKIRPSDADMVDLFKSYLKEVQKLWKIVDSFDGEEIR